MLAPGTAPRETVEGGRVDRARPRARWTVRVDRGGPPPAPGTARARDASTAGGKRFSSSGYPATLLDPIV
jgi:hypothetical protein